MKNNSNTFNPESPDYNELLKRTTELRQSLTDELIEWQNLKINNHSQTNLINQTLLESLFHLITVFNLESNSYYDKFIEGINEFDSIIINQQECDTAIDERINERKTKLDILNNCNRIENLFSLSVN